MDKIQATESNLSLTTDERALHICIIRDMFLRLPDERFEIGVNHLGKQAFLSFDANRHCFNTHGLYCKNGNDDWVEEGRIYLDYEKSFEENVKAIRETYEEDLSGGNKKEIKRSAKR